MEPDSMMKPGAQPRTGFTDDLGRAGPGRYRRLALGVEDAEGTSR
jgi:hypothetical protein